METRKNTQEDAVRESSNVPQGLSLEQAEAAFLRAQGVKQAEIAERVHTSLRTIQNWCARPEFIAAVRNYRTELWSHTTARLQQGTFDAIDTLRAAMTETASPWSTRAWAARAYIQLGARALEVDTLNNRVHELEAEMLRLTAERKADPYQ